jgi:hypothetical protein
MITYVTMYFHQLLSFIDFDVTHYFQTKNKISKGIPLQIFVNIINNNVFTLTMKLIKSMNDLINFFTINIEYVNAYKLQKS